MALFLLEQSVITTNRVVFFERCMEPFSPDE